MVFERKIGMEIKTLSNLIKRCIDERMADCNLEGLTGLHGFIIGYLYHHSGKRDIFQRDIEKTFKVRRSSVTGVLKLMEKNGFIVRESVEQDARLKRILLTPKAYEAHETILRNIAEIEDILISGLSEEEVETFFSIMDKIKNNLKTQNKQ